VGGISFAAFTSQLEYAEVASGQGANVCDAYLEVHNGGTCFNVNDTVYFNEGVPAAGSLIGLGLALLVFVLLQGLAGFTPGKLATGIRTVKADGTIVGIPKAFLRWVMLIVDGQPCGLPLVGFITGLTTQGHRRVGDMVAKTFVVRASAVGSPIVVPGMTAPPPPTGGWGAPPPASPETWGAAPPPGGWGTLVPGAAPAPPADPTAAGWAAPSEPAPVAAAPVAAPGATPQWDEARGTYIQWDPAQSAWLQWDEPAKQWVRIAGQ
jgi:RDD family